MNSPWQIDLFDSLNDAIDMQDVIDTALKIVKPIGFDYAGFRSELPLPMSKKRSLIINTVEDDVSSKAESGYYDETPLMKHCSRSIEPFFWTGRKDDKVYLQIPEMAEEYQSSGRYGGWAQSFVESKFLFNIFWLDSSSIIEQRYIDEINFKMQWISTSVLIRMGQVKTKSKIKLNRREKEILKWSGDGKTADQIGQILNLSHSTVNFHIRNAMFKLSTPNKTSAIVKAIYLGLLR